ncbi:MAG: trypsin-like peptidase domain-containing protein [Dehalococcoidales bacterium]|jgi:2-alkenal reductase
MKKIHLVIITVLLAALLALAGCTVTGTTAPASVTAPVTTAPAIVANASLAGLESAFEEIYARVNPSVVNISVVQKVDNPFTTSQYSGVLGSGFLWDKAGHIVTNNHVIADGDNITVTFYDGTEVPGTLIGADADSDLAVIKVDMPTDAIEPLQIADSTQLKVGQMAIAIGNPFGLQGTMTTGIISGLGRLIAANENAVGPTYSIPDIIQTDAAINPGNSGGVLLDDTGSLIGVTNSIATTTGTSAGVGFAIPSAIVEKVVPALIETGHFDHPYIGASILSLTSALSTAMDLPANQRGAMVSTVTVNGPADKAGLRASGKTVTINGQEIEVGGDVIIAYNGQTVKSSDDLITLLARTGTAGDVVTLTVLRDGQEVQVAVTLGVRPVS